MSILSQFKQSQNTDFPNVRPSLDLRFALAKKLDPRITFTRGSTGTYFGSDGLMRTAGVNEPRFDHDPVTGQSLGLLIEEPRTNQMVRGDIEGSVGAQPTGMQLFGPSNGQTAVVSTDVFLGPNGQSCKHTRGTWADNNIGYMDSGVITAGSTYVFSAYVYISSSQAKNFVGKYLRWGIESANSSSTYASADVTIVDRWQRVFGTCVPTGVNAIWVLRTDANVGSFFYTDCWQLELGSLPTSYMPASGGSQFIRSADLVEMTGTNFSSWYNSTEGTIFVDCASPTVSTIPVAISDGTVNNRFQLEVGTNARGVRVVFNGILQTSYISYTYNTKQKMIMSYSSSSVNFVNAGVVATLIRPQGIPNVNILRIGANVSNAGQNNLPISRLTYYPIQLTNQQLINLTS